MQEMFEAQAIDFPFVAEMPKRERSKVGTLWDRFNRLKAITEEKGMLLPPAFCAKLLGVCRQRVYALADEGRLEKVEIEGQVFVTEESFIAWSKAEHKNGRPAKCDGLTVRECVNLSRELTGVK